MSALGGRHKLFWLLTCVGESTELQYADGYAQRINLPYTGVFVGLGLRHGRMAALDRAVRTPVGGAGVGVFGFADGSRMFGR